MGEFGHLIGGRDRRAMGEIGRACILVKIYCLAHKSAAESDCGKSTPKRRGCCRRNGGLVTETAFTKKGSEARALGLRCDGRGGFFT